ncbi:MAG: hypothetical protein KF819_13820 [Labilithrix sp.]|nr:hypothetical protein [Labilithrix sp.]
MRHLRFLALAAPVVILPLVACEDDGGGSSGVFEVPETGTFEAGPVPEAGPPSEAAPDVVVPSGVTVTVLDGTTPKADVRVLFHDTTGAITGDQKTNATGRVVAATAPAMVTVLTLAPAQFGTGPSPVTYVGVADGDNLVVKLPRFENEVPAEGSYTVSLAAPFDGAIGYYVNAGTCGASVGDPAQPTVVPLYPYCVGATNAVLVSAEGEVNTLAFAFAKNVAKPVGATNVNVGPLTFAARGTATITATNLPANTSRSTSFNALANGVAFSTGSGIGLLNESGVAYPHAIGFADAIQTSVAAAEFSEGPGGSTRVIVRREATPAGANPTFAYDLATLLPALTGVTVSQATPSRPDVTWTSASALTGADAGAIELSWSLGGQGAASARWTFIVPPGTTTIKVPAVPADAPDFVPSEAQVRFFGFVESTLLPNYAAVKALPIDPVSGGPIRELADMPLPANGTVRLTTWGGNRG